MYVLFQCSFYTLANILPFLLSLSANVDLTAGVRTQIGSLKQGEKLGFDTEDGLGESQHEN